MVGDNNNKNDLSHVKAKVGAQAKADQKKKLYMYNKQIWCGNLYFTKSKDLANMLTMCVF